MDSKYTQRTSQDDMRWKVYSGPPSADWHALWPNLAPHRARLLDLHCPRSDVALLDASLLNAGRGIGPERFGMCDAGYRDAGGADVAPTVDRANQRSRELQLGIEFDVASADNLPYADASCDVLTMFDNLFGLVTPRSARLAVLAEARRVLKPGGLLFLEAASLYSSYRGLLWIRLSELIRGFYNPCRLEPGDKLRHSARRVPVAPAELPRSHWFRPREIDDDAREMAFDVVHATTVKGILRDPSADSHTYHGEGRLLYVLQRPAGDASGHCRVSESQP